MRIRNAPHTCPLVVGLLSGLVWGLGASLSAQAQTTAPSSPGMPSMTLDQAVQYALVHNPSLAASRAQVDQGRQARQAQTNRWLPRLGASAQFLGASDNNTSAVIVTSNPSVTIPRLGATTYSPSLTVANGASWRPYASSFLGIGVTQEIFDFGLTAAQIASADATLLAERHDLTRSLLDTRLAVTESFLAVQVAHQVLSAATSAVQRAGAQRDQAAALVNGQLRSRIFLDRAQAELSRLKIGELSARAGVAVAQGDLAAAIGFDSLRLDALGVPSVPEPTPPVASVLDAALTNDPTLKSLAAQIEAQRQTANAIADLTHPALYLTSTVSLQSGGAPSGGQTPMLGGALPETPNWDIGLLASWSFFDPVVLAQARSAHAQENVLRANLESARQKLIAAVQSIWETSLEAEQALPELQNAYRAASENYDQARVRFEQGLGTSVEIADAETLLTDSEVQVAEGRFGLARARAQLDRAMAGGL